MPGATDTFPRMRLPATLLALVLLTACTSSGKGPEAGSSPSASTAASATPTATTAPTAAPVIDVLPEGFSGGFNSPTDNISCDLSTDSVTCSMRDRPWKQMPIEGDCTPGQWETVVTMSKASTASLRGQCHRPDGGPALTYGHGVQLGKTRCLLRQAGLECVILGSAQGFFASRSTYRLTAQGSTTARIPASTGAVTRVHPGFHGGFQSPSGNIKCSLDVKNAGCLVEEHTWKVPGERKTCEGEYDEGDTPTTEIWVEEKERGEVYQGCRYEGDFGGLELAYGTGLILGDLRCRSLTSGIECTNLTTKHGFLVSKASYRVF